jgi:hypothetical protein
MCQKSSSPKILILDWGHCTLTSNRLSYNAEILRQSGMQTVGRTQIAARTAATANTFNVQNGGRPSYGRG